MPVHTALHTAHSPLCVSNPRSRLSCRIRGEMRRRLSKLARLVVTVLAFSILSSALFYLCFLSFSKDDTEGPIYLRPPQRQPAKKDFPKAPENKEPARLAQPRPSPSKPPIQKTLQPSTKPLHPAKKDPTKVQKTSLQPAEPPLLPLPTPTKGYITSKPRWHGCIGLGNMLFHYASLSGIAWQLDRSPYLSSEYSCLKEWAQRTERALPNFAVALRSAMAVRTPESESAVLKVDFGRSTREYENYARFDNPQRIMDEVAGHEWVEISGDLLHSYHYFHHPEGLRRHLMQVFHCSDDIVMRNEWTKQSIVT